MGREVERANDGTSYLLSINKSKMRHAVGDGQYERRFHPSRTCVRGQREDSVKLHLENHDPTQ